MRPRLFNTPSGINFTKRSGKGISGGAKRLESHLLYTKKHEPEALKNVSSSDFREFASLVDEKVGRDSRIGEKVNPQELKKIIAQIKRETGDRINPREAKILEDAIFKNN